MVLLILCREYELWFVLRTPPSVTMVVCNKIIPHVYLRVVACRQWNHELWLVAAKDILRLSFEDVERE